MISPFVGVKVIEKVGSLRFWGSREGLWIAPGWSTFKKIVVAGDSGLLWRNNDGHVIMNIQDFLLNPDSLDL